MTRTILSTGLAALLLSACGVEGLINTHVGEDYEQPVSTLRGTLPFAEPETLEVLAPTGDEIPIFELRLDGNAYEADLISGNYETLRVVATKGQARMSALVPSLAEESAVDGIDLTPETSAQVMVVEGLTSALEPMGEGDLSRVSGNLTCILGKKLDAALQRGEAFSDFDAMVGRIAEAARLDISTANKVFEQPKVEVVVDETTGAESYALLESPLNSGWISRNGLDYDGDGTTERDTLDLDAAFLDTLASTSLDAPTDPDLVRVIFAVNFNAGRLDGLCRAISRFRWVSDEPGKQMYFVGGLHKTSPAQSTEIDAMLGNTGSWSPNTIPMFDDGTHGDQKADDGIWTIFFDLPRGARVGYKYTWGKQGDPWTGSEEWPGNQRILEIVDLNDDGYVYKTDDFGDEATNKDLSNLATGSLAWDEDVDGDGYAEATESPVDLGVECNADDNEWVTPDWVPALTLSCEEFTP